jgi:hypothetical protein
MGIDIIVRLKHHAILHAEAFFVDPFIRMMGKFPVLVLDCQFNFTDPSFLLH